MKKTIKQDMPIGELLRVEDVLPPPEDLVLSQETVKVTLSLSKSSINFFKQQAERCHTKYQRMIRQLVDMYAARYSST